MTTITLSVTGAKARASVNGPLTSGMVGIPVTIEYDAEWTGLRKNLVCRCGKWGPEKGETRTVLNIQQTANVAHEVMRAGFTLYLGIEGYSTDGKLVIPTTWANCGLILPGANADADPSANPATSIWKQLQTRVDQLTDTGLSSASSALLVTILRNCVYSSDQSANITALESALVSGESGEEPHVHSYTPSVTKAATCETAGVRTYTCSCGHSYTEAIPATGHNYADGTCANCGAADPDASEPGLLYNWDFTRSLTDTVAGNVAALNGAGATQDSNGLSLVQSDKTPAYASFAANIHGANRRYEFDVSSITRTSNLNVYFLHCTALAGLFYISNAWKFYSAKSWAYKETGLANVGAFNGKTVSIVINEDYSWDLYVDGEPAAQSGEPISKSGNTLTVGCTSTTSGASMELLITGLRVYDLGGV